MFGLEVETTILEYLGLVPAACFWLLPPASCCCMTLQTAVMGSWLPATCVVVWLGLLVPRFSLGPGLAAAFWRGCTGKWALPLTSSCFSAYQINTFKNNSPHMPGCISLSPRSGYAMLKCFSDGFSFARIIVVFYKFVVPKESC